MSWRESIPRAAAALEAADALLILSGPGMATDAGLPDLRSHREFWQAFPAYQRLGLRFVDVAHASQFTQNPEMAWGFFGRRLELCRAAAVHAGFVVLRRWNERIAKPTRVVTSCVDGLYRQAGFLSETVAEVYGSIHYLQCARSCCAAIWENHEEVPVDPVTMRALTMPRCPACGEVARPNILMFGDDGWLSERADIQHERVEAFLDEHAGPGLTVIELGVSAAVSTLRQLSEELGRHQARVVCINSRECGLPPPHLCLPLGPMAGLIELERFLTGELQSV
jgi:NAD-dependent SIR2 family protein deacetylase